MATSRTSERFCALDADTRILSSDGVLFKVHRKNLEVHSDAFADLTTAIGPQCVANEPLALPESSAVLDLLFQSRPNSIIGAVLVTQTRKYDDRWSDAVSNRAVTEAAEKYVVHSALGPSSMGIKDSLTAHPLKVLLYAMRRGQIDLANESAQQSMSCRVAEAMDVLPADTFKTWILFYERWKKATASGLSRFAGRPNSTPLLQKCLEDPNPACTFRQELGTCLDTVREMKFMTEAGDTN
ncbi:hypothetical protein B0H19DRAFT_1231321 [Mycena capillaripes]|nr:hypothetical protein B0H19DRAFT_1231321 [Mycena capillaripes]